jgi:putative peptidoglycan lipid II flippase
MIYGTVNVPILHYIAGDEQVGWYSLAVRWVGIPIFITTAVGSAFFPEFSKHGRPITSEFAPLVNRAITIVLLVTVPAAVGIGLVANDLIYFIYRDGDYERSIVLMQILAIQMPITAMDSMLAMAMVASDRLSGYLYLSAAAAVLNPIACVFTINLMQDRYGNGAIGTALVMVATESFVMIGAWIMRSSGVMDRSVLRRIGRILAASAVMAAVVWAMDGLPLAIQIVAGMVTYVAAGFGFGAFSVHELREIVQRIRGRSTGGDGLDVDLPMTTSAD